MRFTKQQFDYLKRLSKLEFNEYEEEIMCAELEEFIDYIDVIKDFDFNQIREISDNALRYVNPKEEKSTYSELKYVRPKVSSVDKDIYNAFIDEPVFDDFDKSIAVKDNILIEGLRATAGSNMLFDFVAPYDAEVIKKLKKSGFRFCGKTNMDEFAMGFDSSTSFKGRVLNPLDINRSAGGSSGGSAAAVASGLARYALGTDTGGSILQPASYMGLVGFKSINTVSRQGLISYGSTLDAIGPITRNVSDARSIYEIICDSECKLSGSRLGSYKIWVPDNLLALCENKDLILNAAKNLGDGKVVHFDMPFMEELVASYYVVSCALASSNLGRYDDDRFKSRDEGFGFEVKKRILLGNFVLSEGFYDDYFRKAYEMRLAISNVLNEICADANFIVMPVTRSSAPLISSLDEPLRKYTDDVFTCWTNSAITVPCGNDKDGMPVGLQIVSANREGLFELAEKIEDRIGGFAL